MVTGLFLIGDSELIPIEHYKEKLDEFLSITAPFTEESIIVSNHPKRLLPHTPRDIRIITEYFKNAGILGGLHAGLSLSSFQTIIVVEYQAQIKEFELSKPLEEFVKTKPDRILFDNSLSGIYSKSVAPLLTEYLENPFQSNELFGEQYNVL